MLNDTLLTIINRNADGLLVIDQEGVIRFCNPAAEQIFGISAASLMGTLFGFPVSGGETTEIDILRSGQAHTAEMRVVAIEWEGSSAFLASMRDITERKQAQAAILLRNRAIEASSSGIFIIDANHVRRPIIYVNTAFEQITGYTLSELGGMSADFLYACNPDVEVNRVLDEALLRGNEVQATVQCERKDGNTFWSELRLSPIYNDSGQLSHIVGVQDDITSRKILEAEQIEREKIQVALAKERELRELKDRFLTMMSHELRTPLALIRLSHDMLRQYGRIAPEEERMQYLDSIRSQVEHLTDMISDVMTISRADRVDEYFMPEVIDLITFCRTIVEEFQLNYHKSHLFSFLSHNRVIRAPVDKRLLRQALTNLLSNAVKYSPSGGEISLTLQANGQYAHIVLCDEGMGIPTDDLERLFQPFHRGRNAESIPGTGLGLSIVQQAIKVHNGTIDVQSTLGEGTCFTLKLPMVTVRGGHSG